MEEFDHTEEGKKKVTKNKTFTVPFALREIEKGISMTKENQTNASKEKIINKAFKFHSEGNIQEAAKCYKYFINQGFNDHRVYSNYGVILKGFGKLKEAELFTRKAIEFNKNFGDAHLNLGNILIDLGKLKEAEVSTRIAIELNPDYADAHLNLGIILRDLGKLKEARLCSEKMMSIRSWSILGSYSFNQEMKLD